MMTDADFIREVQSCERTLYRVSRTIAAATRIAATLFRRP